MEETAFRYGGKLRILNKQLLKADRGWSSILGIERRDDNSSR